MQNFVDQQHTPSQRREARRECFSFRSRQNGLIPIWIFTNESDGRFPALLINISDSGCCMLINKNDELPEKINMNFIADGKEITTLNAELQINWKKSDYSIEHESVGIELSFPSDNDHDKWKNLINVIDKNQYEFIRCLYQ